MKRNDRYFFEKYSTKFRDEKHWRAFVFSNIIFGENDWIGNFEPDHTVQFLKRVQSMSYRFRSDLKSLFSRVGNPNDVLIDQNGEYPIILDGSVNYETVVIMDLLTRFTESITIHDTLLWPTYRLQILKSRPFIQENIDLKKMRQITLELYKSYCPTDNNNNTHTNTQ